MNGKTIFVTGTNSGLGKATVEYFARAGWNVAATVRDVREHPDLFQEYPLVTLYSLDVTDQAQVEQVVQQVLAHCGHVDVVVNNAGFFLMGPLETNSMEQIRAQYEVNVFGLMAVTKAFIPHLRARRSGMVINIASSSAKGSYPFVGAYGSSKWAVAGLSEALAVELAPFNIGVKTIFPGTHATGIFTKIANGMQAPAFEAYRPYVENFLALQEGVPNVSSPEQVAIAIYKAVTRNDERIDYVVGRDAALVALLKRVLPSAMFKRMQLASILRPPSRGMLAFMNRLMGGTDRLQVNRDALNL